MKATSLLAGIFLCLTLFSCTPQANPLTDGPRGSGSSDNSVARVLTFTQVAPEGVELPDVTLAIRARDAARNPVDVLANPVLTNPAVPDEGMTYVLDERCVEVVASEGISCTLGDLSPGEQTSVTVYVAAGVRIVCSASTLAAGGLEALPTYRPLPCLT
jgi:hypothetical protein